MDRRITKTRKDTDGDITALCNPGMSWSPRKKSDAISDIENSVHTYYVNEAGYRSDIKVVKRGMKKHLQTTADSTSDNNLDNLPDC